MDTHHHTVSLRVKSVLDSCGGADELDGKDDDMQEVEASQQVGIILHTTLHHTTPHSMHHSSTMGCCHTMQCHAIPRNAIPLWYQPVTHHTT